MLKFSLIYVYVEIRKSFINEEILLETYANIKLLSTKITFLRSNSVFQIQ